MGSLSAHLRQPDQHARLPFHPECPICRDERLVGTLASAALVPARGRAAVAAGVLALSAVAPPATLAQEPDQTREGVAAPDAPAGDGIHGTDFDPGGATIELPDEPTLPLLAGQADDAADPDGPVELAPETDTAAPIVGAGEQAAGAGTPTNLAEGARQQPVKSPAVSEVPARAPAPTPPTAQAPVTGPSPSAEDAGERTRANAPRQRNGNRPTGEHRPQASEQNVPSQRSATRSAPLAPAQDAAPVVVAEVAATETMQPGTASAVESNAPGAAGHWFARGDRVYVVRAGDSLWSIAADRLGREGSVAAIAREVNRLWELNRKRIGTGDPDLVMVGTRLMLR